MIFVKFFVFLEFGNVVFIENKLFFFYVVVVFFFLFNSEEWFYDMVGIREDFEFVFVNILNKGYFEIDDVFLF